MQNEEEVLAIEVWGGIGDCWLATPAPKALHDLRHERKIRVLCYPNHLDVLEGNPHVDYYSADPDDPHFANVEILDLNYGRTQPSLTSKKHAIDIIADLLNVSLEDRRPQIFLTPEERAWAKRFIAPIDKPVVMHTRAGGRCSSSRRPSA